MRKKHDDKTPIGPKADKRTEKLIAKWKTKQLLLKPLELEVKTLRAQVTTAAVMSGGANCLISTYGVIPLQTKKTTDWEGLARKLLKPEQIDAEIQAFTTESAPFAVAPRAWSKGEDAAREAA